MNIKQGRNPKLARLHNRALVLKNIIQFGGISRKDLADAMGLTRAAISGIVDALINEGLVKESMVEDTSSVGRRPIPLTLDPDRFRILTLYVGRSYFDCFLTNALGGIIEKTRFNSDEIFQAKEGVQASLLNHVKQLIREWRIKNDGFFGIAVTAPGPVRATTQQASISTRRRFGSPYLWGDLGGSLRDQLKCPVFSENDANTMALAEQWFGCGRECDNFILYTIGEGIGAAAIIDGMLFRGHNNVVGEVGHVTVDLNGPQCSCGNYGCLELYAGFKVLRDAYVKEFGRRRREYHEDLRELFDRCRDGDKKCAELIKSHTRFVSIGAVSLANMFSPEKIVVASYDGDALDLHPFVADIDVSIKKRAFSAIGNTVRVEHSILGPDILAYGGTALVMDGLVSGMGGTIYEM